MNIAMSAGGKRAQNWIWLRPYARVSAAFNGWIFVKIEIEDFFFTKTCREIRNLIKLGQKYRALHMKTYACFMLLTATYVTHRCQYLLNCRQLPDYLKNKKWMPFWFSIPTIVTRIRHNTTFPLQYLPCKVRSWGFFGWVHCLASIEHHL
jgi:hypothetical protein